jgi:hypothetical protein
MFSQMEMYIWVNTTMVLLKVLVSIVGLTVTRIVVYLKMVRNKERVFGRNQWIRKRRQIFMRVSI